MTCICSLKVPSQGSMHVYNSLCKSVLLPFLSSKKLHATENRCLKTHINNIISSGVHFNSYCLTMLSNFFDPASFSHPFKHWAPPFNLPCIKTVLLISSKGKQSNNGFPQHDNQDKLLVILNFAFTWDLTRSLIVAYGAKVNIWDLPAMSTTWMVVTNLLKPY